MGQSDGRWVHGGRLLALECGFAESSPHHNRELRAESGPPNFVFDYLAHPYYRGASGESGPPYVTTV